MPNTPPTVGAYVGAGGSLVHLDESRPGMPADPLMAKQLAKGSLRLATEPEAAGEAPSKPAGSAPVAQWREWAVANGLPPYEAEGMTKKALLLWADDPSADDEVVE